ncbi:uncharacterized protein BKA78DRAFT_296867 [Phyllosticta capitalensis]|uniref:uncharacterized protein n=1 Tax=Phyllosticta capitalensis TaxID=121624 RepID=UPI003131A1C9
MVRKIQRAMSSEQARQGVAPLRNSYHNASEAGAPRNRGDPRIVTWRINDTLRTTDAQKAAEWLIECMESNEKNAWLVDAKYHKVDEQLTDVEHFAWQIAFLDLKTGELLISTNIDYHNASAEKVWQRLYQHRAQGCPGFEAFRERFVSQDRYGSGRTNGLLPSMIEQQMRQRGFSSRTLKLVSWSAEIDMTATWKILREDDDITAGRWSFDDLNRGVFNPISIVSLVQEMAGIADDTLPAVFGRMFFGEDVGAFDTAECDIKALWRILKRLYECLVA